MFHLILNELEQTYHGESGQPSNEQGPIVTNIMNSSTINSLS
jgi:hypothetical protein